jgi:AcrR family transcriptional regulator
VLYFLPLIQTHKMDLKISIKINDKLYLRDPELSELGRRIVREGAVLVHELGIENFTFKKLAEFIGTTEASIYRYFENKHCLLVYFVAWYWGYMEYMISVQVKYITDPELKLKKAIELLLDKHDFDAVSSDFSGKLLFEIIVNEGSKSYLTKGVDADNTAQFFKPYKDFCSCFAGIISEYRPDYPFPRSLASTLVETAHYQSYFTSHLPRLTDFKGENRQEDINFFLEHLAFSALGKN